MTEAARVSPGSRYSRWELAGALMSAAGLLALVPAILPQIAASTVVVTVFALTWALITLARAARGAETIVGDRAFARGALWVAAMSEATTLLALYLPDHRAATVLAGAASYTLMVCAVVVGVAAYRNVELPPWARRVALAAGLALPVYIVLVIAATFIANDAAQYAAISPLIGIFGLIVTAGTPATAGVSLYLLGRQRRLDR